MAERRVSSRLMRPKTPRFWPESASAVQRLLRGGAVRSRPLGGRPDRTVRLDAGRRSGQ
jgi:hypothetical protein